MVENKTCRAWLEWLALQYPEIRSHVIKIDNEGLNRAQAVRLGLHPKASDYFIAYPLHGFSGFWLEVKADGWRANSSAKRAHMSSQLAFGEKMIHKGYHFAFCVGVDECIAATQDYLKGG